MRTSIIFVSFCLLCAFVSISNAQNHILSWGNKTPYDRVLFTVLKREDASIWPFKKVVQDVIFPPPNSPPYNEITYIQVIDQYNKLGKSGTAYIKEGGIGQKTATIHLKSDRGEGFAFLVEVFGH